jgi:hypothetical protein
MKKEPKTIQKNRDRFGRIIYDCDHCPYREPGVCICVPATVYAEEEKDENNNNR